MKGHVLSARKAAGRIRPLLALAAALLTLLTVAAGPSAADSVTINSQPSVTYDLLQGSYLYDEISFNVTAL